MRSPYISSGGAPAFGPPGGMAGLIGQPAQIAAQDRATGSANMRMLAEWASAQGEKHKSELQMGKAAEAAVKASPTLLNKMGMTLEAYQTLSAQDKTAKLTGAIEGDAFERGRKEEQAKTKALLQQIANREQEAAANTAFGRDMSGVYGRNTMQTLAQGNVPVNPPAVGMDQLAAGLSPEAWQSPQAQTLLRELAQGQGAAANPSFYSRSDVGKMIPVEGADGYGLAVTGPNQAQAFYTGKPQGSAVNVPGVGDVGVITTKPGQTTIVPGQMTYDQIRQQLTTAEANVSNIKTKIAKDPELTKWMGGQLAEQENLAASYRDALAAKNGGGGGGGGQKVAMPAVGEVRGKYRFKGGNPKDKANWEAVE